MADISFYELKINEFLLESDRLQTQCSYDRDQQIYQLYNNYNQTFNQYFENCGPNSDNLNDSQSRLSKLLLRFFNTLPESSDQLNEQLKNIRSKIEHNKLKLMQFICHVEQSPQILKKKSSYNAIFRCLLVDELGREPPEVCCRIVNANEVKKLYNTLDPSKIDRDEQPFLENSTKSLVYQDGKRCATFDDLKIIETKRSANIKSVLEDKCALLFFTRIIMNRESVLIWALSDPVVQITHGNQMAAAEGTIFWVKYFPLFTAEPFTVKNTVSCRELKNALEHEFNIRLPNRLLCKTNTDYIYETLLKFAGNEQITSEKFLKTIWKSSHSFWVWFYSLMRFLKRKENVNNNRDKDTSVQAIWEGGLISGFVSKDKAAELLTDQPVGTFLIRFSETTQNALNVVIKISNTTVECYTPWEQSVVEASSLANCIFQLSEARFLFSTFSNERRDRNEVLEPYIRKLPQPVDYPKSILIQSLWEISVPMLVSEPPQNQSESYYTNYF